MLISLSLMPDYLLITRQSAEEVSCQISRHPTPKHATVVYSPSQQRGSQYVGFSFRALDNVLLLQEGDAGRMMVSVPWVGAFCRTPERAGQGRQRLSRWREAPRTKGNGSLLQSLS